MRGCVINMKKIVVCCVAIFGILLIFSLYVPRPIVSDTGNATILISYNPHFNDATQDPDDIITIENFDKERVLDCLRHYSEQKILFGRATKGFGTGDIELSIFIVEEGGQSKTLSLGNTNYSYQSYGGPLYKILDAKNLTAELLEILNVKTTTTTE